MTEIHPPKKIPSQGAILVLFLAFIGVLLIALSGVIQLVNYSTSVNRRVNYARQATYLAEAGIERSIAKLNQTTGYTGETITLPNPAIAGVPTIGTVIISIANIDTSTKEITSTGYVPSSTQPQATRGVRTRIGKVGHPVTFNNGAQVGDFGITMANNSTISGNVFSNGPVLGATGTTIAGTVISAGSSGLVKSFLAISGNVVANTFEEIIVSGNASGRTCKDSTIVGNLAADTIDSCTVSGTTSAGVPDTAPEPLSINQTDIDGWKQDALNGGVLSGNQTISVNTSLGPKKIVGDLSVDGGVTFTLTGTLWVTGQVHFDNNAIIRLDSSYGSLDGVLVADGRVIIDNNVLIQGSGTADSYILLLTTNTGSSSPNWAIDVSNNANGAIIYAGEGTVHLNNNAIVKQVTAKGFDLANNAQLVFEAGIINSNFINGLGTPWVFTRGTYRRVQ